MRKYDLVLFGATGYTGKLCCRHIHSTYENGNETISWAIAGRSRQRLEELKKSLKLSCDIIIADTGDMTSVDSMVSQTSCVANLVGPYMRFGGVKVVEACVRSGASYVDLTGESEYYADLIDKFHEKAKQTGSIMIPSSGFDSVPGDLTTILASEYLCKGANPADEVVDAWMAISTFGWFSSGTFESLMVMAAADKGDMIKSTRADWLSPIKDPRLVNDFSLSRHHKGFRQYGAWLFFAPHNTRVTYRTWGLVTQANQQKKIGNEGGLRFSKSFKYQESVAVPFWIFAVLTSIVVKLFTLVLVYSPLFRRVFHAILPANGGPPEIVNTTLGYMDARTIVTMKSGRSAECKLAAKGDPGYQLTSKMLIETALTLVKTLKEEMNPLLRQGGVFTPALGGGQALAKRLQKYAEFEVAVKPIS